MSSEALAWAFKQECKSASVKFTLVALCECANYKTGRIMPSVEHLSEITGQNRKTIIANVAELEAAGFIRDTGERVGRTMQIKVYEATLVTVPKVEQSQTRNSSVSGRKQSQKRDTEPSLEPSLSTEPKGSSESSARKRADAHPCPAGVDAMDWEGLKSNRKAARKPLTDSAYRQITNKLSRWQQDGWPPGPIVANAAERGWLTVFETDEMKGKANGQRQLHGSSGQAGSDRRDGIARALDRRLGLDDAPGPFGRRPASAGEGNLLLAAPPADPLF